MAFPAPRTSERLKMAKYVNVLLGQFFLKKTLKEEQGAQILIHAVQIIFYYLVSLAKRGERIVCVMTWAEIDCQAPNQPNTHSFFLLLFPNPWLRRHSP